MAAASLFGILIAFFAVFAGVYMQHQFNVTKMIAEFDRDKKFPGPVSDFLKRTGLLTPKGVKVTPPDTSYPNNWEHVKPFGIDPAWPPARLAHDATAVGDYVYIHGGLHGGTTPKHVPPTIYDDLWRYDEFHDKFEKIETTGDIPKPRFHHTLVASGDGKSLIVYGGFDDFLQNPKHKAHDDGVYILDLETQKWKNYPSSSKKNDAAAPTARASHEAVIIQVNGKDLMLVYGGFPKIGMTGHFDDLWSFDLETKKWSKLGDSKTDAKSWPQVGRQGFPLTVLSNGTGLHMFGGGIPGGDSNDEWVLDFSKWNGGNKPDEIKNGLKWRKIESSNVPSPRRAPHGDAAMDGFVFLFGGLRLEAPPQDVFEALTKTDKNKEEKKPATPIPTLLNDFYLVDTIHNRWMELHAGNYGRGLTPPGMFGHTITAVKNRHVLVVFGGRSGTIQSPGSNDVYEYHYSPLKY